MYYTDSGKPNTRSIKTIFGGSCGIKNGEYSICKYFLLALMICPVTRSQNGFFYGWYSFIIFRTQLMAAFFCYLLTWNCSNHSFVKRKVNHFMSIISYATLIAIVVKKDIWSSEMSKLCVAAYFSYRFTSVMETTLRGRTTPLHDLTNGSGLAFICLVTSDFVFHDCIWQRWCGHDWTT